MSDWPTSSTSAKPVGMLGRADLSTFGIQKEELKDECFLSRLRNSGLGDSRPKEEIAARGKGENSGEGRKKDRKAIDLK